MSIRLTQFGGIVPRLHAEKLPDTAAQTALNCRLTRGVLEPIDVESPFTTLLNDDGTLKAEIPAADLVSITKPDKPALAYGNVYGPDLPGYPGVPSYIQFERGLHYICQPRVWLKLYARTWVHYVKGVRSGDDVVETYTAEKLQEVLLSILPGSVHYTESGFTFSVEIPGFDYTFNREVDGFAVQAYHVVGPLFQFACSASSAYGGPDSTVLLPAGETECDSVIPSGTVPLVHNDNIYATLQVADVAAPNYGGAPIDLRESSSRTVSFPAIGDVSVATFVINMNYTDPARKHYYYVQTAVTADDEEGPPSELSNRITIEPGQYANLTVTRPDGYTKNKLYRSTTGGDDFALLDDVDADSYTDDMKTVQAVALPPYGNYPDCNAATFLEGSVIHPEQFAAAYYEDHLYLSDFYRFWVWPEEYAIPFQANIDAIALSGNTIIVFVDDKVFGVSGGNPEHMAKYLISDNMPLLSKKSLARIGQTVLYAASDGLAGITGGQVSNLSKAHYTRNEWLDMNPADMTAKVADDSVFLEGGASNLRIDLDENELALTTYTATSGVSLTWKSKKFTFEDKMIFDYARILATGTVTLKVYADETLIQTLSVTGDTPVEITDAIHAKTWEFQVEADCIIREMEFYERRVAPAGDSITLTGENVPLWENIWLKFPDRNAFIAGILTVQGSGSVPIHFYKNGTELAETVSVSDGRMFMLDRGGDKAAYWRIKVDTERPIERLELFAQVTQPISGAVQEFHNGGIPPWRLKRYEISDKATLTGAVVHATSAVNLNLYKDGSATATQSVAIPDGGHVRIPDIGPCRWVEFDFGVADDNVSEVILYASPTPIIGSEGISISKPPCWRGNRFRFADRGVFVCGTIGARDYSDLTLRLYADGEEVCEQAITDAKMFYLPTTLSEASHWEVDIEGDTEIDSLVLLPRVRVQSQKQVSAVANDTGLPPWAATKYELPEQVEFTSAIVKASSYPAVMTLGSSGTTWDINIPSGREVLLPSMGRLNDITVTFGSDDHKVSEFHLYPKEVIPIQSNGIVLRQAEGIRAWRRKVLNFSEPGSFSVLRVVASSYSSLHVRLYADGVNVYDEAVTSAAEVALPSTLPNARSWIMDLAQTGDVYELHLIGRVHYSVKNGSVLIRRESDPFTWLDKRILSSKPIAFSSGRVIASAYPVTVTMRHDGRTLHEHKVLSEKPFRIPKMRPERLWAVDFNPVDSSATIHEAALATSMQGLSIG